MTREQLGHLTALRNIIAGAPVSQASLASRLRAVDQLLAEAWGPNSVYAQWLRQRDPDYWAIAGSFLEMRDSAE